MEKMKKIVTLLTCAGMAARMSGYGLQGVCDEGF